MKRNVFFVASLLFVFGLSFMSSGCFTQLQYDSPDDEEYNEPQYDDRPISFFYELDWYGEWIYVDRLGWMWKPDVVYGWRPYYNGHWIWDGIDWVWVSYEPFGWAVYHYGYWTYDPVWGWLWLPDYQWYPCRVSWAIYDDYVAWAPLPPPGVYLGDPWVHPVTPIWVVVPYQNFTSYDVGRYHVTNYRPTTRYKTPNKVSLSAPDVRSLERRTGRTIRPVHIKMDEVTVGDKRFKKMVLPPSQKQTVKLYEDRVSKKVFRPETEKETRSIKKQPPPPKKEEQKKSRSTTKPTGSKSSKKKKGKE